MIRTRRYPVQPWFFEGLRVAARLAPLRSPAGGTGCAAVRKAEGREGARLGVPGGPCLLPRGLEGSVGSGRFSSGS